MPTQELSKKGILSDESLLKMTDGLISDAHDFISSKIEPDRARALDYYNGKPFGNEIDGRSKARSTDVRTTIEWIKPALMKIFTGGDTVVSVQGQGEEDVTNAKVAEAWLNHVVMRLNPGFMIYLTWMNDALLQKNGFVTVGWVESDEIEQEEFEGISKEALDELEEMDNYETTYIEAVDVVGDDGVVTEVYNVRANRTFTKGDIVIENIPPEHLLTLEDTKNTKDKCRFFCIHQQQTLSDLREEGFEIPDDVTGAPISAIAGELTDEANARDYSDGADWDADDSSSDNLDPSQKLVWRYRCIMRADDDGDGIAEWIQVDRVANKIVNRERLKRPPLHSITPIPLAHKLFGLSYAEIVAPIEDIKTALIRQVLDYMYFVNNPRAEIAEDGAGEYTVSDWLNNRPNGMIRVKTQGAVTPFQPPQISQGVFSLFEIMDQDLESRTGVSRHQQGLDPDTLNKTASGMAMMINEGAQRIELIARVFAETGIKDLMEHILELTTDYPEMTGDRIIRLTNGETLTVNAESISSKYDLVVAVGLGAANKAHMMTHMQLLLQVQQAIIQMGAGPGSNTQLVAWDNLFETLAEMLRVMGLKNVNDFVTDPSSEKFSENPPPQPQPSPEAQAAQIEAQWRMASIKLDEQKLVVDAKIREKELENDRIELEIKRQEMGIKGADVGSKIGERAVKAAGSKA